MAFKQIRSDSRLYAPEIQRLLPPYSTTTYAVTYSHQTFSCALFAVVRRLIGGAYIVIVAAVCLAVS
jgi:hypothetical protein